MKKSKPGSSVTAYLSKNDTLPAAILTQLAQREDMTLILLLLGGIMMAADWFMMRKEDDRH